MQEAARTEIARLPERMAERDPMRIRWIRGAGAVFGSVPAVVIPVWSSDRLLLLGAACRTCRLDAVRPLFPSAARRERFPLRRDAAIGRGLVLDARPARVARAAGRHAAARGTAAGGTAIVRNFPVPRERRRRLRSAPSPRSVPGMRAIPSPTPAGTVSPLADRLDEGGRRNTGRRRRRPARGCNASSGRVSVAGGPLKAAPSPRAGSPSGSRARMQ